MTKVDCVPLAMLGAGPLAALGVAPLAALERNDKPTTTSTKIKTFGER